MLLGLGVSHRPLVDREDPGRYANHVAVQRRDEGFPRAQWRELASALGLSAAS